MSDRKTNSTEESIFWREDPKNTSSISNCLFICWSACILSSTYGFTLVLCPCTCPWLTLLWWWCMVMAPGIIKEHILVVFTGSCRGPAEKWRFRCLEGWAGCVYRRGSSVRIHEWRDHTPHRTHTGRTCTYTPGENKAESHQALRSLLKAHLAPYTAPWLQSRKHMASKVHSCYEAYCNDGSWLQLVPLKNVCWWHAPSTTTIRKKSGHHDLHLQSASTVWDKNTIQQQEQ